MFFSRANSTSPINSLVGNSSQNGVMGTTLEQAFLRIKKPAQKLNLVKELINVKVNDPVGQDFSSEVSIVWF